jgi:alpha-1,6-mannosyltransferase
LRIVQIANFYTPTSGGLRTSVDEIGRGYGAAGHDRVLVVPGQADADEHTPSGRRVTLSSPRLPGSGSYHVLTGRRRTFTLLDELQPDVLEVSDKLSVSWLAPWARRRSVPLVLFSHERIDAILRSRVPRGFPLAASADFVNRRLSRLVEHVVVTSRFAAAEFARIGATNVRRVPLGVDLATFAPVSAAGERSGPVRLVMLSRLSREKRPELAVEALRLLRDAGVDAELTVIGDGPIRSRIERRIAGRPGGLPVWLLGHIARRDTLAQLVADADIAVCPSPVETFGLAVLEALACGTPVVVPSDGAAHELVGEVGSGMVCDGSPAGLAQGVLDLLDVPAAQRRSAARAAAERLPWSATVAGLLELYGAVPSARAGSAVGAGSGS